MTTQDQTFRSRERLHLKCDYARAFTQKRSAADGAFVVYVAENGLSWSRLGLSVSRRLGNAVTRNYARRRIREAFRRVKYDIPQGLDVVCVARHGAINKKTNLQQAMIKLVNKAAARRPRD